MARIATSRGEARLRPMLARDEMLIGELLELESAPAAGPYFRIKARMVRALDEALVEAEWEGGFGELPKDEILATLLAWDGATDEEALPNAIGPSSGTPPESGP